MKKRRWHCGNEPDDQVIRLEHDGGNPMPGMLQAIVPFNGAAQVARVAVVLTEPVDLAGKTPTANVQLSSGLDGNLAARPGTFRLYVRSTSGGAALGRANAADQAGSWFTLNLDASSPATIESGGGTYDASGIREIGIEFGTNVGATSPMVAVVLIDTMAY